MDIFQLNYKNNIFLIPVSSVDVRDEVGLVEKTLLTEETLKLSTLIAIPFLFL